VLIAFALVPAPLPHIAGHTQCAERPQARILVRRGRTREPEIAKRNEIFRLLMATGPDPMRDRRQALAGEFGVGGGLRSVY
jgi:hypothetical protein